MNIQCEILVNLKLSQEQVYELLRLSTHGLRAKDKAVKAVAKSINTWTTQALVEIEKTGARVRPSQETSVVTDRHCGPTGS